MTLVLAVIPVLLLIVLMAFFKMPGDKSSIISLIVTMLIALFGFSFSADNLFYSFIYGALKKKEDCAVPCKAESQSLRPVSVRYNILL